MYLQFCLVCLKRLQILTERFTYVVDDFIVVKPENSEANRRIGAKGTNCMLHISPWGVTLALLATKTVLAQWPLKSIRYFEAAGNGQFMLEAGRIAPMGDGTYIFHTEGGKDNFAYDLLDQRIVDALTKMQVMLSPWRILEIPCD